MADITSNTCDICFNLQYSARHDNQPMTLPLEVGGSRITAMRDIDDFKASTTQGCPMCEFIVQAVAYYELSPEDYHSIMVSINASSEAVLFCLGTCTTIQVYTPIGYPPAWQGIIHSQELSSHPDAPEAYVFIETCIARCDQHHPLCRPGASSLPTRLIDVGSMGYPNVRLVETSSSPQLPYIALSYCCGPNMVFKTTLANYQARKQGIRFSILPRTIQDAIVITRRLKQRYLWVDAICIIQELLSDWEFESLNMASVYRNAYLTLAAASSNAVTERFIHQQHPAAAQQKAPFRVDWTTSGGQPSVLAARIVLSAEPHEKDDGGDYLPLSHRGWTLQEKLLARRVVTYTNEELWWTCLSGWACECKSFDTAQRSKSVYSIDDRQEAFEYWQQTVGEFATRDLTESLDKFPAMSGLASAVQNIVGSRYIAGLWWDNLLFRPCLASLDD